MTIVLYYWWLFIINKYILQGNNIHYKECLTFLFYACTVRVKSIWPLADFVGLPTNKDMIILYF